MNCIPRIPTLPTLEPGVTILTGPTTEEAFMIAAHAYAAPFLKQYGCVTVKGSDNWIVAASYIAAKLLAMDFGIQCEPPYTIEKMKDVWSRLYSKHNIRVFNHNAPSAFNMCINIMDSVNVKEIKLLHNYAQVNGDYQLICVVDEMLDGLLDKYTVLSFSAASEKIIVLNKGVLRKTVPVRYIDDSLCGVIV